LGSALTLISGNFLVNQTSLNYIMPFAMEFGNSLRPVRAVLPYFLAIAFYFAIRRVRTSLRCYLIGGPLGIALLWSNDFALSALGVFLLFSNVRFYSFEKKNWRHNVGIVAAIILLTWSAILAVITGGNPLDLLKYNFLDVAQDQWWYFGLYGLNTHIVEISQFTRIFSREIVLLSPFSLLCFYWQQKIGG
jgi:hypothetical protein